MSAPVTETKSATASLAGKYLTVLLETDAYGLNVLKIREIIRVQKITAVPQMPVFVKGVINLRGRVIPVLDLRVRFGLKAELTERACIVVVQIRLSSDQTVQMGLIVDSVDEVVNLRCRPHRAVRGIRSAGDGGGGTGGGCDPSAGATPGSSRFRSVTARCVW